MNSNFTHNESLQNLKEVLAAKLPIAEAWNRIVDFYAVVKPKPYWDQLRRLNVEGEQKDIVAWMETILTESPMPKSIIAMWIGITKIWDEENAREFYAICLRGADNYDSEDIDWADEPKYDPENNYGLVAVLTELNDIIKEDHEDDYAILDLILPIAYISLTIDEIARTRQLDSKLISRLKNGLYVSVGFDEGDHIDLSRIE